MENDQMLPQTTSSELLLPTFLSSELSVSLYTDARIERRDCDAALKRLTAFFPGLTPQFVALLPDMLLKEGFTKKRLADAVDHVIKTCEYPFPTAAKILGFDKRKRLYRHNEVCNLVGEGYSFDDFDKHPQQNGKILWTLRENQL